MRSGTPVRGGGGVLAVRGVYPPAAGRGGRWRMPAQERRQRCRV